MDIPENFDKAKLLAILKDWLSRFGFSVIAAVPLCWIWMSWANFSFMMDGEKSLHQCKYSDAIRHFGNAALWTPFVFDPRNPGVARLLDKRDFDGLNEAIFATMTSDKDKYVLALVNKAEAEMLVGQFDAASKTIGLAREAAEQGLEESSYLTYRVLLDSNTLDYKQNLRSDSEAIQGYRRLLNAVVSTDRSKFISYAKIAARAAQSIGEIEWAARNKQAAMQAYDKSDQFYLAIVKKDNSLSPERVGLLIDRAAVHRDNGDTKIASDYYRQIDEILQSFSVPLGHPERVRYLVSKADFLLKVKDFSQIESLLLDAIVNSQEPGMQLQAKQRLARYYVQNRKKDKAFRLIQELKESADSKNNKSTIRPVSLARTYVVEGFYYLYLESNPEKARKCLDEVSRIASIDIVPGAKILFDRLNGCVDSATDPKLLTTDLNSSSTEVESKQPNWCDRIVVQEKIDPTETFNDLESCTIYFRNADLEPVKIVLNDGTEFQEINRDKIAIFPAFKRGEAPTFRVTSSDGKSWDFSPGPIIKRSSFFNWDGRDFEQHYRSVGITSPSGVI